MREYLIPSKRFGYVLGSILLCVLLLSLTSFPMDMFSITSLDQQAMFKVGWPVPFFEVDLLNPVNMPIHVIPLILSLLGYLIVSYGIDVLLSFILISFKGPEKPETVMVQARKAYFYYKSQGMEEVKIRVLFKQKGWKDEDIEKLK